MRKATKLLVVGAGVGYTTLVCRAMVSNALGVMAAMLSDFEARTKVVPPVPATRPRSTELPPRLKANIEYARTIRLDEPVKVPAL